MACDAQRRGSVHGGAFFILMRMCHISCLSHPLLRLYVRQARCVARLCAWFAMEPALEALEGEVAAELAAQRPADGHGGRSLECLVNDEHLMQYPQA